MERNVGNTDKLVRIVLGIVAIIGAVALFAGVGGLSGTVGTIVVPLLLAVVGAVLVVTGYTQSCPAYQVLGLRTLGR